MNEKYKRRKSHFFGVKGKKLNGSTHDKGQWISFIVVGTKQVQKGPSHSLTDPTHMVYKVIQLGVHDSAEEAARNYDRIAFMKYGESSHLNFPHQYNLDKLIRLPSDSVVLN